MRALRASKAPSRKDMALGEPAGLPAAKPAADAKAVLAGAASAQQAALA